MEVSGKVLERVNEKHIRVEIVRASACGGNCHSCGSCGGSQSKIIAECADTVLPGDEVTVSIPSQRFFLLSFLVFIVPLAVIVAGYFLFLGWLGETIASLAAFFSGVAAFVLIVLAFRKLKMPKARKTE